MTKASRCTSSGLSLNADQSRSPKLPASRRLSSISASFAEGENALDQIITLRRLDQIPISIVFDYPTIHQPRNVTVVE